MKSRSIYICVLLTIGLLILNSYHVTGHEVGGGHENGEHHYTKTYVFDIGKGYVLVIFLENYLPPFLPGDNSLNITLAVYEHQYSQDEMPLMDVTYNATILDANNNLLEIPGTNQKVYSHEGTYSLIIDFPSKGKYTLIVQVLAIGIDGQITGFEKASMNLYIGVEPPNTKIFTNDLGRNLTLVLMVNPYPSLNTAFILALLNTTDSHIELIQHVTFTIIIKDSKENVIQKYTGIHPDAMGGVYSFSQVFAKNDIYYVVISVDSVGHEDEEITGFPLSTFTLDLSKASTDQVLPVWIYVSIATVIIVVPLAYLIMRKLYLKQ